MDRSSDRDPDSGTTGELINLETRKLARELEREFGGLFGIDVRDVERALARLSSGVQETRMPAPVERSVRLLDALQETARETKDRDDDQSLRTIVELMENYTERLQRMLHGTED